MRLQVTFGKRSNAGTTENTLYHHLSGIDRTGTGNAAKGQTGEG